jgi:DNA-binding GntR family transcriptional regulator
VTPRLVGWGAYREIADTVRKRFADAPAGTPVPSEATLSAEFKVVRNTVRRALAELEDEGLIETIPGRGRVVRRGDSAQSVPAYRRIADDLRAEITTGALASGAQLPSETALVERYAVSRGTARQALALLVADGLIDVVHGKGRYVRSR